MTDELSLAFAAPLRRAEGSADQAPPDRISVRDYDLDLEVGAFQSERGVTQAVRFNVVLEVAHTTAAQNDDVDMVLSYDTIVDAINAALAEERLNLLETLAERIAEIVLSDPRAYRIFVRIEKLDRIPGRLGVEIVRTRSDGAEPLRPAEPAPEPEVIPHPRIAFVPNAQMAQGAVSAWIDALADGPPPILVVGYAETDMPHTPIAPAQRRIALLTIEQNAWILAGMDPRCVVRDSRTELEWALKTGQVSVWAPSKLVLDAMDPPMAETPADLAIWLAERFEAADCVCLGHASVPGWRVAESPTDL